MSPVASLAFAALVFLAMLGGVAGIVVERRRSAGLAVWRNPGVRDAILPVAGWASLFGLDLSVAAAGAPNLPVGFRHLLGTLAVLLLYYALLSTLLLIYRSLRRIWTCLRTHAAAGNPCASALLGRPMFPTLPVSAALAALSVLYYDGVTRNLAFVVSLLLVLIVVNHRHRRLRLAPPRVATGA